MDLEAPGFEYDVFLSFRGPDTRQSFADVLYKEMVRAGIRVFRDDDELIAGDKIDNILQAIDNSELCVPIFSKTFASSKWCLEEVKRMVRLKKVIIPIFYKVSVEDVKLKTRTYNELIEKLKTNNNEEQIEDWKAALKAATGFKGHSLANKSYMDFCKEFISDALKKLKPRDQFDVDNFIGAHNQLDRFTELLNVKSADVRYLGIHGMGGIGKTTLAKVIFNKFSADFDCRSFIENIGERSKPADGLSKLEEEHRANLDRTCKSKKVLIVLDDVDKSEQIEKMAGKPSSFGPGSRIVVTTRDIRVLTKCGKLQAEEVFPFAMETLESHHALQLFSSRAFMKNSPPPEFLSLSGEVVSTAGGLPLALVVLGSLLRNEDDKGAWKDIIEKSKKVRIGEVKDRLKISFDKLDEHQKQIFLDIACLSACKDKSKVFSMWEASEFYPTHGIAVLQSMSLIKMKDNNEIWMHDLLRELGRGIVRGESRHPSKRSRWWEHDKALEVLKSKSKKENVQAISLENYSISEVTLTRKQLDTLEILRFLELGCAKLEGDLDNVLPNLRWLSWRPLSEFKAVNFSLPKLVSLDLSGNSFITENWQGWWSLLQGAKNLKDLYLAHCFNLTRTPEFPEHMILERLVLQDCKSLVAVDSIGGLQKLQRLDLSDCYELAMLPPSIGNVTSLIELHLSWTAITELPDSIGSLENLRELRVDYCKLRNLPSRLSDLGKLEVLDAGSNPLPEELPEDIGRLVSLRILDLTWSEVCKLPSSISQLSSLETLNLECCDQLQELPELPTSLSELSISSRSLKKVADLSSMVNLVDLCIVVMSDEEVETSNLNLIEKLIKLKGVKLHLKLQKSAPLPADFSRLTRLENLSLSCRNLKDPLQLPSSLSDLYLWNVNSKEVLRIEDLHSLKKFTVYGCSFDVMDGLHLPQNLTTFKLTRCESLTKLPDLAGLKDLASLDLFGCKKLTEIPGLGKCKSLRSLTISRCHSLERLENLSELEILEELQIINCEALDGIDGIDCSKLKKYYKGTWEDFVKG